MSSSIDHSVETMTEEKKCTSCGKGLNEPGTTFFPCPNCGEVEIGRCMNCRDQSVKYVCSNCGFVGP